MQRPMLDHLARRAARAGVHDIAPTIGDAGSLPFAPASFDAAYLIDVLGEVGDARATLRELRRTLRPGGRLAVGERFVDPDVVRLRTLVAIAHEAGFTLDGRRGTPPIYLARFRAAGRS